MSTAYRNVREGKFDARAMHVMRREYAVLQHKLVVRGFADAQDTWHVSVDDILAELTTLRQDHGWVPELIVIDYGDLVWAPGDSERDRQKAAFRQMKALAERHSFQGHKGYAIWAPSQAVRPGQGADEKEHVLRPRDIADCYEKVRVADAIISLNRTVTEKTIGQARVHLGKYRDAEDMTTVRVITDYDHGAFSKLGVTPPPAPTPDP
jgi:replicative DNA helicase